MYNRNTANGMYSCIHVYIEKPMCTRNRTGIKRVRKNQGELILGTEGTALFNDALNTFYLRLYGVTHMAKDHCFRVPTKVLLYAPSHRLDCTYHGLCCTSCGTLAGTRYSSRRDPSHHERTLYHGAKSRST